MAPQPLPIQALCLSCYVSFLPLYFQDLVFPYKENSFNFFSHGPVRVRFSSLLLYLLWLNVYIHFILFIVFICTFTHYGFFKNEKAHEWYNPLPLCNHGWHLVFTEISNFNFSVGNPTIPLFLLLPRVVFNIQFFQFSDFYLMDRNHSWANKELLRARKYVPRFLFIVRCCW